MTNEMTFDQLVEAHVETWRLAKQAMNALTGTGDLTATLIVVDYLGKEHMALLPSREAIPFVVRQIAGAFKPRAVILQTDVVMRKLEPDEPWDLDHARGNLLRDREAGDLRITDALDTHAIEAKTGRMIQVLTPYGLDDEGVPVLDTDHEMRMDTDRNADGLVGGLVGAVVDLLRMAVAW